MLGSLKSEATTEALIFLKTPSKERDGTKPFRQESVPRRAGGGGAIRAGQIPILFYTLWALGGREVEIKGYKISDPSDNSKKVRWSLWLSFSGDCLGSSDTPIKDLRPKKMNHQPQPIQMRKAISLHTANPAHRSRRTRCSTTLREFEHGLRRFRTPPSLSPDSIPKTSVPFFLIDCLTMCGSWSQKWSTRP